MAVARFASAHLATRLSLQLKAMVENFEIEHRPEFLLCPESFHQLGIIVLLNLKFLFHVPFEGPIICSFLLLVYRPIDLSLFFYR